MSCYIPAYGAEMVYERELGGELRSPSATADTGLLGSDFFLFIYFLPDFFQLIRNAPACVMIESGGHCSALSSVWNGTPMMNPPSLNSLTSSDSWVGKRYVGVGGGGEGVVKGHA